MRTAYIWIAAFCVAWIWGTIDSQSFENAFIAYIAFWIGVYAINKNQENERPKAIKPVPSRRAR